VPARVCCAETKSKVPETVDELLAEDSVEGSRTLGSATTKESPSKPASKRLEASRVVKSAEPLKPKSLVVHAPQEPGSRVKVLELALAHAKQEAEKAREETKAAKEASSTQALRLQNETLRWRTQYHELRQRYNNLKATLLRDFNDRKSQWEKEAFNRGYHCALNELAVRAALQQKEQARYFFDLRKHKRARVDFENP